MLTFAHVKSNVSLFNSLSIMNNKSVINAFMNGKSAKSSNGNLYVIGNKLVSYWTTIAQRTNSGMVIFNATKYSVSTSKIQTWTLNELISRSVKYKAIYNVPMGASDLERYV